MDISGDPSNILCNKMQESVVFIFLLADQTLIVVRLYSRSIAQLELSQTIADSLAAICEVSSVATHAH
jgi:hypothetical protein